MQIKEDHEVSDKQKPVEPNPMPSREPRPKALPDHDEDDLRQIMKDVDKRYEK